METQDLRIGNLGQDREGRLCQVEQLSLGDEPRISAIKGGLTSLPVKPITITDKSLDELLGIKLIDEQNGGDHFYYHADSDFTLDRSYQHDSVDYELKYIHQVQNVAHVLTGKQLPTPTK